MTELADCVTPACALCSAAIVSSFFGLPRYREKPRKRQLPQGLPDSMVLLTALKTLVTGNDVDFRDGEHHGRISGHPNDVGVSSEVPS
jgi:hypothetical protein